MQPTAHTETEPAVILVNTSDEAIGQMPKQQAHLAGKLHRAFSIFLYRLQDGQIEILLQQRHADKYHCGNLWTNSCCSHPKPDESLAAATCRRLDEELSTQSELTHCGHFIYHAQFPNGLEEHELDHVFIGYGDAFDAAQINTQEIQAIKWIPLATLETHLGQHPEQYTPWLAEALCIARPALLLRETNTGRPR